MFSVRMLASVGFQQVRDFAERRFRYPFVAATTFRNSCIAAKTLLWSIKHAHRHESLVFSREHSVYGLFQRRIPESKCRRIDKGECVIIQRADYEDAITSALDVVERDYAKLSRKYPER